MQSKPLSGIRVLEFGGYISLPFATSMLGALGADVVKVERDRVRRRFPPQRGRRKPLLPPVQLWKA